MEFKPGDTLLGKYQVVDVKRGGFGIVYLSRDLEHGINTAIKTFQDYFFREKEVMNAFYHEAEVWVRLGSQENLVTAFFATYIDEKPHLLLEYVDGGNLRDWMKKGRLEDIQILQFAIQFCNGMIQASDVDLGGGRKGIVHRDIKPENIMLTKEGWLKVTDFGLVKALGGSSMGKLAGTPEYMSPEQFKTMDIDQRSDIYSFGAVMYEMLTGKPPFYTAIEEERWNYCKYHHQEVPPKPPSQMDSSRTLAFKRVTLKCLGKHPANRYRTFEDLKSDLEKIDRENFEGKAKDTVPPLYMLDSKILFLPRAQALVSKGFSFECLGKFEEALECFDLALRLDSSNALAWTGKGIVLNDLNKHKDSIGCLNKALELQPRDGLALLYMGLSLLSLGKFREAIAYFDKALDVNVNNSDAWNGKGAALLNLGNAAEATKYFKKALQLNPMHVDAWYNRGLVAYNKGDYSSASKYFEEALKINPKRADAWNSRGGCLIYLSRIEEALKCFEQAMEIKPYDTKYRANREVALKLLRR